jgi:hypothetical protein
MLFLNSFEINFTCKKQIATMPAIYKIWKLEKLANFFVKDVLSSNYIQCVAFSVLKISSNLFYVLEIFISILFIF